MSLSKLFQDSPVFETKRLMLRQLSPADAEDYFEIASSPVVTAQTTWKRHLILEDSKNYIKKIMQRYENQEEYHWAIVYQQTGKVIGRTGLIRIDPEHDKAELGYVLSHHYWNQGIVTEATRAVIDYAFCELGINRVEARCNAHNTGSYRVMEKLGLQFEGLLRQQLKIHGVYVDQRMYAIIRDDYLQL